MSRRTEPRESEARVAERRWVAVIMLICLAWLAAMVAASYFGLVYKSPVRIEHWKPEPSDR